MRAPRFLLDANVLADAQCRDLLLRLAAAHVIEIRWSDRILAETSRALARMSVDDVRRERVMRAMTTAFPEAAVPAPPGVEERIRLPDPDDRHVLASAVGGECDVVVTHNLRDFPVAVLHEFDLVPLGIDDALLLAMTDQVPTTLAVVHDVLAALHRPTMTLESYLDRLWLRAPGAATALGAGAGIVLHRGLP